MKQEEIELDNNNLEEIQRYYDVDFKCKFCGEGVNQYHLEQHQRECEE